MRTVLMDLNIQVNSSTSKTAVDNKGSKSSEKDFLSTLKTFEESKKVNDDSEAINKKIVNNKSSKKEVKNIEEIDNENKETDVSEENVNIPMNFTNFLNLMPNNIEIAENNMPEIIEENNENQIIESVENKLENEKHLLEMSFLENNEKLEENIENITLQNQSNKSEHSTKNVESIVNDFAAIEESNIIKKDAVINNDDSKNKVNDLEELISKDSIELDKIKFNENYIHQDKENLDMLHSEQNQQINLDKELIKEEKNDVPTNENEVELNTQFVLSNKNEISIAVDELDMLDKSEAIDKKDIINQIVEKVKFDFQNPKNEVKIKLKPDVLGEMVMKIEVEKGLVTAKIVVDNHKTKEIIEGNLIQLKEEIKNTGLEIKTFEVFVKNDGNMDKHNLNYFNFNRFNRNNGKIAIKGTNQKASLIYDENLAEVDKKVNIYGESVLNLLA